MKRNEIPSLDDLRAFETVARLGSVRAAAEEIALTHGAVSRRITKLAQDIGVELFERDGRGIKLTMDGEKLAKTTQDAFSLLSGTLSEIKRSPSRSPITLSCERSLALNWLIPRLSVFQDIHPDIELQLSVGGGTLDFTRDRITLAIRRLDFPLNPNWIVTPLMKETIGPVMSPSLVPKFHAGGYIALASKTRPKAWEYWLKVNKDAPAPKEVRYLDHHFLMLESAINGLGVAMCPERQATDHLKNDRLSAPFGFQHDGSDYGLIHPQDITITEDIIKVKSWLQKICANFRTDKN